MRNSLGNTHLCGSYALRISDGHLLWIALKRLTDVMEIYADILDGDAIAKVAHSNCLQKLPK